jgi:RNA polymerase sigma-70 factor (ECF subfamily)
MNDNNITALRDLLLADYGDLNRRLTRRLGSADLASDVLHETYLRLERINEIGPVLNPKAYLFRIAINVANDRRRAENRRLTTEEADCLLEIPDHRPDAARVIEDRSEVALLRRVIAKLPERRRQVLFLSRVDDLPNREIAERLGITVRTVETDLKQAIEHCAEHLKRPLPHKFGFRSSRSSYVQRRVVRSEPLATGVCGKALDREKTKRSIRSIGPVNP